MCISDSPAASWTDLRTSSAEAGQIDSGTFYPARAASPETVTIAVDRHYPPLSYLDEQGRPTGFLIDFWRLWSQAGGRPIRFRISGRADAMAAVRGGQADLHAGLFMNAERTRWMAFSAPFHQIETAVYSRADTGPPVSLDDLRGLKAGALKGSAQELFLRANYPLTKLITYPHNEAMVFDLLRGRIKGLVGERPTVEHDLLRLGLQAVVRPHENILLTNSLRAGLRNDKPELLKLVNEGLGLIPRDQVSDLAGRWFPARERRSGPAEAAEKRVELTPEERDWLKNRKSPIVVGAETDWPPFDFVRNGRPVGYSTDLIRLAAQKAGLKINFIHGLSWAELVRRFRDKEVDILPAVYKTPEREREMALTEAYVANPSVLATHTKNGGIKSLDDLNGRKVAVVAEFSITKLLLAKHPEIIRYPVENMLEALTAVSLGKADAAVGGLGVLSHLLAENVIPHVRIVGQVPLRKPDATHLHMAVSKDQTILRDIVQKGLAAVTPEEKNNLRLKWLPFTAGKTETAASPVLTDKERRWLAEHPKIRIGIMNDWPPMDFVSPSGIPSGIGIDYLKLLSEKLGDVFEVVPGPFKNNLELVKARKIDALMDVTPKKEREKFLNFTRPYLIIPHVIVARRDGPYHEKIDDLKGKTVALEKGFATVGYLQKAYPNQIKVEEYPGTAHALDAVLRSRADAYIGNRAVAAYLIAKELMSELQIQGRRESKGSVLAIGVRKDWPELAGIIDKVLAGLSQKEHSRIVQKWVGPESRESVEDQITAEEKAFLEAHPKIRLGVEEGWAPFSFINKQGEYEGICSDYIGALNRHLKIDMEPVKGLSWAEMLKEAQAGRIDVISPIAPNKEREKYLNFTNPFLKAPLAIINRNDSPIVESLADLKDGTIAVTEDYVAQLDLRHDHPDLKLVLVDRVDQALRMVSAGEAAAALETVASLEFYKRRLGLKNLKVAAPTPYYLHLSLGVRKDWPLLVEVLDKFLTGLDEDQKMLIRDKWMNIQIQKQMDWGLIALWGGVAAAFVGAILAVIIIWNRRMAREVIKRKEAEERFTNMAANVPGAIFQLRINEDQTREYAFLSARAEEFFGDPPEVVIRDRKLLPFHPEDAARVAEIITGQVERKDDLSIIGRIITDADREKWIRINASPATDHRGALIYNGFILDITERMRAEKDLEENRERLEIALEAGNMGTWDADFETGRTVVDKQWAKLLGYELAEVEDSYQLLIDTIHPEDLERYLGAGKRYREGLSDRYEIAYRVITRDGRERWFVTRGKAVRRDERGEALRMVGTVRDVTDRVKAEEEVRLSQAQYRQLVEDANSIILRMDKDGAITFFNEYAQKFFGYSAEEAIGRNIGGTLIPETDSGGRDLRDLIQDIGLRPELYEQNENENIKKDGTRVWVSWANRAIYDDQGRFTEVLCVGNDITERKKAEAELKRNEALIRAMVASVPGVIYRCENDGQWTMQFVSDAIQDLTGYPAEEFVNSRVRSFSSIVHPDDEEQVNRRVQAALDQKRSFEHEYRMVNADGETRWVLSRGRGVYSEDEELMFIAGAILDNTDVKKTQQERDEALEMITGSINYATAIQRAILPPPESLKAHLADHFIIWEPRDGVGGDIYFFKPWGLGMMLALGDCTGHGVPGAFMTMIANGALEMALLETMPGDVAMLLQRTNQLIQSALKQDQPDGESDDGLEMGICYIVPGSGEMTYAGARFSLFCLEDDQIQETKGDKKGLGYRGVPQNFRFTNHQLTIGPGRSYFMTSDGILDQVGGPKRRGFGKKRFKKLLIEISDVPMEQKAERIRLALKDWQGAESRRDDVSVLGFTL